MNSKIFVLAAILLVPLALSVKAFADDGGEAGGGENAVVCFDSSAIPAAIRDPQSVRYGEILDDEIKNHVTSIEAYDLFEARMPRGLSGKIPQIIDIKAGEGVREYSERIAKRYADILPNVADAIRKGASAFSDDKIILRTTGLDRVHDERDVGYIDSLHCVVATMAHQYWNQSQLLLQIDRRLFQSPKQSDLSRAVLFLHECAYYSARTFAKHTNSRATRMLVGALVNSAPQDSRYLGHLYRNLNMPDFHDGNFSSFGIWFAANWYPKIQRKVAVAVKRAGTGKENIRLTEQYNQFARKISGYGRQVTGSELFTEVEKTEGEGYERFNGANLVGDEGSHNGESCFYIRTRAPEHLHECVAGLRYLKSKYAELNHSILRAAKETALQFVNESVIPDLDKGFSDFPVAIRDQVKDAITLTIKTSPLDDSDQLMNLSDVPAKLDDISVTIP